MKKQIRHFLIAFAVCSLLTVPANAHSGGTDENGGHYDGGDYHYHHGYSAHDHYDMDGDGDIDCPYDFRDNVDHNRGESYSGGASSNRSAKTTSEEKPGVALTILQVVLYIIAFCIAVCYGVPMVLMVLFPVFETIWNVILFISDQIKKLIDRLKSR